jgi:hypothetical protein
MLKHWIRQPNNPNSNIKPAANQTLLNSNKSLNKNDNTTKYSSYNGLGSITGVAKDTNFAQIGILPVKNKEG